MTIDLTGRYDTPEYLRGGRAAWTLDRSTAPVRAVVLHHSGGWYGAALTPTTSEALEVVQLDALAVEHRARFGAGPGYHYAAFPSGRLYAVGKWGTHRAHTAGRNPATRERWNVDAVGVCAFGDYSAAAPSDALVGALREAVEEARRLAGAPLPVHPHGDTPTVDAVGVPFAQATACPGDRLLARLREIEASAPPGAGSPAALRAELEAARARIDAALALVASGALV
ncbi:MAG: N-acetylmuramoyl-L-alanine amidase [Dehalococcoidia bacterium]